MIKYKLGVFKSGDGRIIDLDKIIKVTNLEKLDEFTMGFSSEEEFKLYLCRQELITKEELEYKIRVTYTHDDKIIKIPVIYKDMEKYMDRQELRNMLVNLSEPYDIYNQEELADSIVFLEKLANHYYIQNYPSIFDIRFYINNIKHGGDALYNKEILKPALDELYKKIIYKKKSNSEVKIDYVGLRDLAVFIYKYKKNSKEKKEQEQIENENNSWNQLDLFSYQNNLIKEKKKI